MRRGPRSGLFCVVAVHSTVRGPSLGGCRMWRYDDSASGVADALRLSRAMTYKAALRRAPARRRQGRDHAPRRRRRRAARARDVLLDFGETVDAVRGAYITAEDVGTSSRDMTVIAEATKHVTGLAQSRGGSGDPSPYTALGVAGGRLAAASSSSATPR